MLYQSFHGGGYGLLACGGIIVVFTDYEATEILGNAAYGSAGAEWGFRVAHCPKVLNNIL